MKGSFLRTFDGQIFFCCKKMQVLFRPNDGFDRGARIFLVQTKETGGGKGRIAMQSKREGGERHRPRHVPKKECLGITIRRFSISLPFSVPLGRQLAFPGQQKLLLLVMVLLLLLAVLLVLLRSRRQRRCRGGSAGEQFRRHSGTGRGRRGGLVVPLLRLRQRQMRRGRTVHERSLVLERR